MRKKILFILSFSLCVSFLKATLPSGYTSIYDLNFETERCPYSVNGGENYQFVGPASGWGDLTNYDLSSFKQLAIKLSYDASSAGNQVAVRFAINVGAEPPVIETLPGGTTSHIIRIGLESFKNTDGSIGLGGLVFYNGASHWAFTYTGTPNTNSVTVDYIALSSEAPTGLKSLQLNDSNEIVNVFSVAGVMVRKNVKRSEAIKGLKSGFYIVGNQKVFVSHESVEL